MMQYRGGLEATVQRPPSGWIVLAWKLIPNFVVFRGRPWLPDGSTDAISPSTALNLYSSAVVPLVRR